jgi:hypothetical protein
VYTGLFGNLVQPRLHLSKLMSSLVKLVGLINIVVVAISLIGETWVFRSMMT